MKRLSVSILSKTLCLISFISLMGSACGGEREPYNILMIAIDDMNNWVGVMNDKAKTPHIDSLARSGMLFNNAYCVTPACNPSRTALMTGLRPETTGQFSNRGYFRDLPGGEDILTLAQYLQQNGYETIGAGKIFHHARGNDEKPAPLSDPPSWDFQRKGLIGTPGLELFVNTDGNANWLRNDWKQTFSPEHYYSKYGVWGAIPQGREDCGDWQTAGFCAEYLLDEHEKPFFLACGIFRPHLPQIVPQEYFDRYPLESIELPEVPDDDMDDIPETAKRNQSTPFFRLIREHGEWEKAVQGYLASMSFADDCVGRVLDALENSRYRDNTIVLLWTDHGWQLGHKQRWSKFTLWRQSTNAPMIIRYPGMESAGKVCSEPVSFLDLYPTLIELAGLEERAILEGESLMPWMLDPGLDKETPAIVTFNHGNYSVVWKNWNYIRYRDGSEELYDHDGDPREYDNLAGSKDYRKLMDRLGAMIPGRKD